MFNKKSFSPEFFAIVVLCLAVPVFFHKILLTGKPLFGSDFVLQFYPWKQFIYENLRAKGQLPFWNPHVLSGTPFIGNIQASMFYPLGCLFYLVPPDQAYGLTIMLHFILGAIFMYVFARSIALDKAPACLAAFIFTFNGFLASHLYAGHLTFVQNYIWIPLIFFCLNKFCGSLDLRAAACGGLCLGLQILGGFPQIAFYTILAVVLFALWQGIGFLREGKKTNLVRLAAGTVLLLGAGFCLAAVQIFPTYEFAQLSARSGGVSYEFATSDSFDPIHFLTFVMPNFFGSAVNGNYWKSKEIWQFWEMCAYIGIAPLLLMGFIRKKTPWERIWPFFACLAGLALVLSLGRYNPLYRLIYYLPGFSHFRIPAQILYLYIFAAAILAGVGLNSLDHEKPYPMLYRVMAVSGFFFFGALNVLFFLFPLPFFEILFKTVQPSGLASSSLSQFQEGLRLSIVTASGFFVLVCLLIHWHRKKRMGSTAFTWVVFLVAVVDLWSFCLPMIQTTSLDLSSEKKHLIKSIGRDENTFRLVTSGDFLKPNDALLYGYHNVEGYDPLILKSYLEYINKSQNTPHFSEAVHVYYVTQLDNNLIRLLNLKYAVLADGKVLKLDKTLPRAFMVPQAVAVEQERILDYMMSADFDPKRAVLLSPDDMHPMLEPRGGRQFEGSCIVSHYDNDIIRILASANEPGYMVLSELFYPGWKARVDGEEAAVLCGNYLFRVIRLDKGNHDIELRFVSRPFRLGLAVSLLTLSGCLGFICRPSRKRSRGKKEKSKKTSAAQQPLRISIQITRKDGTSVSKEVRGTKK